MRPNSLRALFAVVPLGLSALLLPSCADNDSLLFVVGVYARKAGTCTPQADSAAPIIQRGALDRLFASDYVGALLIGNQITERGSREQIRTETSHVRLLGADIRLTSPEGKPLSGPNGEIGKFSTPGTGFVDAASGTDPSYSIMYANILPASIANNLAPGLVIANVRVFGETLGGEEVTSSELLFPIDVCDGCLVQFPAEARDVAADASQYICRQGASEDETTSATVDEPCTLGIDIPFSCTMCSSTSDACKGPATNPYYTP